MANVQKFTHQAVPQLLRHYNRETLNPSNPDIDPERSGDNYALSPDRGTSLYSHYLDRKSGLYCYGRADVKTMCSWVVTAPRELPPEQYRAFFEKTYDFLENRYGKENVICGIVHMDETQPHLHFAFIPAVPDLKHGGEKICANDVLTRSELRDFHPALQRFLHNSGINAKVHTGITGGKNRTVDELKRDRQYQRQYEHGVSF